MKYAVNTENKTLDFTVVSYGDKLAELMSFKPYLSINKSALNIADFSKVEYLSFTVFNNSDVDSVVVIQIESLGAQLELKKITVSAHSSADVLIKDIGDRNWSNFAGADTLSVVFENVDGNSQKLPDRDFAISEIYRSLKEI